MAPWWRLTGYVLMFPFWVTGIVGMQIAHLVHALVALLYIAAMVFHVYMGTVGEEGAFEGMWDGTVDEELGKAAPFRLVRAGSR